MYRRRKGLTPEEIKIIWDELPSDVETPEEDSSSDEDSPEQNKTNNQSLNPTNIHKISDSESDSSEDTESEEIIPKRIWKKRDCTSTIPIFSLTHGTCVSAFEEYKRRVTQGLITMSKVSSKKRGRPRSDAGEISELPPPKKRKTANFSVSDDIRQQKKDAHWPDSYKNKMSKEREMCEESAQTPKKDESSDGMPKTQQETSEKNAGGQRRPRRIPKE
ncbi:hypothetical protein HNY73_007629 [Argiope bruennichi]|uniref:Uncharacterized protein n=1 Tax=Argiope bruennichi TaxID=94029 RepID=A0A8T0FK06_ARGBR|nr:hypothetical protein HNY73_007629 [Argiope bruennichi]